MYLTVSPISFNNARCNNNVNFGQLQMEVPEVQGLMDTSVNPVRKKVAKLVSGMFHRALENQRVLVGRLSKYELVFVPVAENSVDMNMFLQKPGESLPQNAPHLNTTNFRLADTKNAKAICKLMQDEMFPFVRQVVRNML